MRLGKKQMRRLGAALVASAAVFAGSFSLSASAAGKVHGMAMQGEAKYKAGFKHWDYADPAAIKGGNITLASPGTFDSLNPFAAKGMPSAIVSYGAVFETLLQQSEDEAFAEYGLLAESFELAADGMSVTFYLNPKAAFSDGKPVTADDVVFSFNTLMSDKANPMYKAYWADVKEVKAVNKSTVRFDFKQKNPELHLILGQVAVLPKHFYGKGDFANDFNKKALGSGPYVVKDYEFGKFAKAERNPNYWGNSLPSNVGKYNFESINLKYFKDGNVMFEAFKAGEFDYMVVASAKQWAVDATGDKFDKNWIVKKFVKHGRTSGMQGFALNQKKPIFQDRNVRHALALALDFDWMNKTLFFNQYKPHTSYWDNGELQAKGLPSPEELKLLEPLKGQIPAEVFTAPMGDPIGKGLDARGRVLEAKKLIESAGYTIKDGVYTNAKGQKLEFSIMLDDPSFQRIVEPYISTLKKLGVNATMKMEDKSIFEKKHKTRDYDVIVESVAFSQSESPGNEQRSKWHSSQADVDDSDNIMGIKNPAIDKLVDTVITAKNRKDLVTATHALDRVLWNEYYVVPQWYINGFRLMWWNRFDMPKTFPAFGAPGTYLVHYGWLAPAKDAALTQAKKDGKALPKPE